MTAWRVVRATMWMYFSPVLLLVEPRVIQSFEEAELKEKWSLMTLRLATRSYYYYWLGISSEALQTKIAFAREIKVLFEYFFYTSSRRTRFKNKNNKNKWRQKCITIWNIRWIIVLVSCAFWRKKSTKVHY